MPDTHHDFATPRRRGAPYGNLNALKTGNHTAALDGVDFGPLPPDLKRFLRTVIATAVRAEVAAVPRPHTSEQRRAALLAGLRRVYDCLIPIDWSRPRPINEVRELLVRAVAPVVGDSLFEIVDLGIQRKNQRTKE